MRLTDLQKKYFAWDITHKKSTGDDSRFTGVLSEARVDLNPHQVDAALFAFKSPLSKGAILADEVGLGKTIEAGIILSQSWAEHRRRILIIVPASLRNQWNIELREKFFLPSTVMVGKLYDESLSRGQSPLLQDGIVICSYHFAAEHADEIGNIHWDLVVLDEAHKLRNVYKKKNKIAKAIRVALQPYKKVLLTATPLQNNLNELYGLVSIIDGNYFSSLDNFSDEFNAVSTRDTARFGELKYRLQQIIHRTLRRQVQEYVRYTKRSAMVQEFTMTEAEQDLYDKVREYLASPFLFGIPESIRPLLTITISKIMASSAHALAFTLEKLRTRIEKYLATGNLGGLIDALSEGEEIFEGEGEGDEGEFDWQEGASSSENKAVSAVRQELSDLDHYMCLAQEIREESKAKALVEALGVAFRKMEELGAERKALIFTESCRTQEYLYDYLCSRGFEGKIVCFNGTNNSPQAKQVYSRWLAATKGTDRQTGDPLIDKKQALTDFFENEADIMIATEAGAEGINLQFCSLVVNYDMPWNPQRIEQRIGRVHRYGQKHDVVVVNFVNKSNAADCRVYELLNSKFQLFDGVFGSSDEILGAIESDIDFEKRLADIYQNCRTEDEINAAFDRLQAELDDIISERMQQTKKTLLEHFDEEVIQKLKSREGVDTERISMYCRHIWELSLAMLAGNICDIDEEGHSFTLREDLGNIPAGRYSIQKDTHAHQIRSGAPIGEYILDRALEIKLEPTFATFDLSGYKYRSSTLEKFKGQSGYCIGYRVSSSNEHDNEEELLICGLTENGERTPDDFGKKLLELDVLTSRAEPVPSDIIAGLDREFEQSLHSYEQELESRMNEYLNIEIDKLSAWADDNVYPMEKAVRVARQQLQDVRRTLRKPLSVSEKLDLRKQELNLSQKLREAEKKWYEAQDYYEEKAGEQIKLLEKSLNSSISSEQMFIVRWSIV